MTGRRILIGTDAWHPQVNGVVRTLDTTVRQLHDRGHTVAVLEPSGFWQMPCPLYPEIPLCVPDPSQVAAVVDAFKPTSVHVATEGPIGLALSDYCRRKKLAFTTSYHTKFPEYLMRLVRFPLWMSYGYLKWFHRRSAGTMVATPSLGRELRQQGFRGRLKFWSRGVDLRLFYPRPKTFPQEHRPISMYVGRVSSEKGIEDFLRLKTPGRKYVVGDGPAREELERQYPDAVFLGYRKGESLAEAYANADVFVFPSRTDTFGLVIIEALASGVPVAAYPTTGPIDIVRDDRAGALDDDLGKAVARALDRGRAEACVGVAGQYSWENCTRQFVENLVGVRG